jgi:hypothetical protein
MPKVRNIHGPDTVVITARDKNGKVHRRHFTAEEIAAKEDHKWRATIATIGGYKKTRSTRRLKTDSTRRRKRSKQ